MHYFKVLNQKLMLARRVFCATVWAKITPYIHDALGGFTGKGWGIFLIIRLCSGG